MYNYEWDIETGGYVLSTKLTGVTKEVRPVFAEELNLLGFDKLFGWKYSLSESPIMWAEGRRYIYRGEIIAEVNGGGLYEDPTIVSKKKNLQLISVDVPKMLKKNASMMSGLEQTTMRFIYDTFLLHEEKGTDIVYVAFSGGKDSIVLLDLVQRALPHDKFHIIFADTTMELTDTYIAVKKAKERWTDLNWHDASAEFDFRESWRKIGPPAEKMRWCCSVHKTAPQVLLVKKIVGKQKIKTLVYVGIRKEESEARSTYEPLSEGKKHIMQTSCSPLLEWNTSEIYLYMLANNLYLNASYRKGLTRAGCAFCPMSSKWSFFINRKNEPQKTAEYVNIITELSSINFDNQQKFEQYFNDRNWKLRMNGRDLKIGDNRVIEIDNEEDIEFFLTRQTTPWEIWLSCIGELIKISEDEYSLQYVDLSLRIKTIIANGGIGLRFRKPLKTKNSIRLLYLIKNALHKAAYCIGCHVCEVECPIGALHFDAEGKLSNKGCIHCGHCIDREKGCIVAKSLTLSKGVNSMERKNIAGYQTRGFRQDWLEIFFEYNAKPDFWVNDRMGPNMFIAFKTWLRDSGMIKGDTPTELCKRLLNKGSDSLITWGMLFVNLAYSSALINWFVKDISMGVEYDNSALAISLGDSYSKTVKESAIKSLKETLKASPIGMEWGLGIVTYQMKGNAITSIEKIGWQDPEPLVILYSLYLFAEHFEGGNYNFTLTDLYDDSYDREALSPKLIFGTDGNTLKSIMQGLANDYRDYISVDFNKGIMENVYLNRDKRSIDIIDLI